jgi:alpha-tubulin suppressor-like RCC1 family protein
MIENGHALALVNGAAYGWGDDGAGQLGDGQRTDKTTPALATDLSGLGLTHVVASGAYSLGLNAAGNVYAWGSDYNKALGTGRGTSSQTPMLVDSGADEISGTACNSVDR